MQQLFFLFVPAISILSINCLQYKMCCFHSMMPQNSYLISGPYTSNLIVHSKLNRSQIFSSWFSILKEAKAFAYEIYYLSWNTYLRSQFQQATFIQSCCQNVKGNLGTILFKNIVILVLDKQSGHYFCQGDGGSPESVSYAGSFQQQPGLRWTQTSFKDTHVMTFFYCDHFCNCTFKRKSYIFQPI